MLISNQKEFIFIHTWKTGGTSVKKALEQYSDETIFTNDQSSKHLSAEKIRDLLEDKSIFESYFKFLFIRNPWDVQVSYYSYANQRKGHFDHEFMSNFKSFDSYIEWRVKPENLSLQKEFAYDMEGNCLVDFIGKFESIEIDFNKVCSILKLGEIDFPCMNSSIHFDYKRYYSSYSANLIKDAYHDDIILGDYSF